MLVRVTSQGVFVGRERELSELVGLLDEREPVAVVVRGDAGVGKTRLVERFLAVARERGWEPAVGHCEPLAAGLLPAGALLEAVRGAPPAPAGTAPGPAHDVHARLLALLTGPAPAVLVLEDVHWADALTLGAVPYLLRAAAGRRLLVVLTLRTDEPRVERITRSHLAELDRWGTRRVTVPPLGAAATRALALALGGPTDEPAVARLHERSGGNPFYVEELVRSGATDAGLPESVREQVVNRLDQLPPGVARVVARIAIAARPVCHDLLAALDGVEPVELVEPLRQAHAAGVLAAHPDLTYSFRHGLVREAVVAQMLPAERRHLHRRMAETLSAPEAPRPPDRAEAAALAAEIAHHWRAAADAARAVDAAVTAGVAALRVPAPDEARAQFERALAEWDDDAARRGGLLRAEVEQRAAETALLAGDAGRAARHLRAAIAAHGEPADPVVLGTLHHQLGRSLHHARAPRTEVDAAYRRARHLVPLDETGPRTEVEVGHLLLELSRGGGPHELVDRATDLVSRARAAGHRSAEASALFALTRALDLDGQPQRAVRVLERAVERAQHDDDPELLGRAAGALGSILARRGEFRRAADVVLPVLARLGEDAPRTVGATLVGTATTALVELGRWSEVDELLGRPGSTAVLTTAGPLPLLDVAPAGGTGLATSQVVTLVALTALDLLRGRPDDAGQRVEAARRATAPVVQEACRVLDLRAAAWRGDVDGARRAFAEIAPLLLRGDRHLPPPVLAEIVGDVLHAIADAGPGRRGTGPDVLPDADRLLAACRPDDGWGRAVLAGARAERLRVEHRSAAVAEWRAAVDGFTRAGARPRAAYARWRLAEALLTRRSAEGPVELRRAALDAAELGMDALTPRIEATARAARVPFDDDAVPRVPEFGLTEREQQVLHLLVTGRTNKQIAAELFISDRTAGTHVSRVLAKLGANNRAQATAMWLGTAERGGEQPVPSPRRSADDPAGSGRYG